MDNSAAIAKENLVWSPYEHSHHSREQPRKLLSAKELVELGPSAVGVIAALFVVMSISHEYGFFYRIGISFFMLLTISDHLASYVSDFPVIVASISGVACFLAIFVAVERHESANKRKTTYYKLTWEQQGIVLLILIAIIAIITAIFMRPLLYLFISVLVTEFSVGFALFSRLRQRLKIDQTFGKGSRLWAAMFAVLGFSATMASLGYFFADRAISSEENTLRISLGSEPQPLLVKPLRYTSNYLIVYYNLEHKIIALPISDILRMDKLD